MTEEERLIYELIASMPGKSMSQKLNFFQDISKSLGVDAFGVGRDFVEEQFYEQPNEIDVVWGRDPVASALFDAVDEGMSPMEAYQAAVAQGLVKEPGYGETPAVDYMDLTAQYATAEAKRRADREMFDMKQANKRALFEAESQPSLSDLFNAPTVWEAAGSPTEEKLVETYAQGLERYRPKKEQGRREAVAPVLAAGKRAALGPLSRTVPSDLTADRVGTVESPRISRDPVIDKFVRSLYQERARKDIPKMQSKMMPTAKGEEALRAFAMLKMFGD